VKKCCGGTLKFNLGRNTTNKLKIAIKGLEKKMKGGGTVHREKRGAKTRTRSGSWGAPVSWEDGGVEPPDEH